MDAILANLLGWSLQVAVVVAGAAAAAWMMRVDAAPVRHAWWRAVLVVCLALPILQPWHAATHRPRAPSTTSGRLTMSIHRPSIPAPCIAAEASDCGRTILVRGVVARAGSGIVVRLAWLAAGLVRLRRLRRIGSRPADRIQRSRRRRRRRAIRRRRRAAGDIRNSTPGRPAAITLRDCPSPSSTPSWLTSCGTFAGATGPGSWWRKRSRHALVPSGDVVADLPDPVVARGSGRRADAARDRVEAPLP